jgi:coenzyme F420-0:L-glutamate ligase / coenzyme F420-1:gamma-L-glutamate ligase
MTPSRLPVTLMPVPAAVQTTAFDLIGTLIESLAAADTPLRDGDILAVSSKYCSISEGRVVRMDDLTISEQARALAVDYSMNPVIAELVVREADHIFGGIQGFLLTFKDGILSPNAGIDRSNIPSGYAVLFPQDPFASAARIRTEVRQRMGADVGVILTDSWLMPGRLGTTGVALAMAGFKPLQDERGKPDLFGNPMIVTVRSIADTICAAAQLVMGERDEACPFVIVRNVGVELGDFALSAADVSIDWNLCIYVQSLTAGLLKTVKTSTPDT